jgi:hypothetical protein
MNKKLLSVSFDQTFLFKRKVWFMILVVILIFMLSTFTTDAEQDEFISQILDDLPDSVKKILKEEGVDLEELKNDPELRREMQKKVMDNPNIREEFQKMVNENRKSEEAPQGKSEDKQRGPKGNKRQGKGGGGVDEYYKSIVDNNLFKPLGWKGDEKGGPAFRLVGTVIARGRAPKALIFEFAKNTTHYVAMGDKIGNATVKSIDEKSVTIDQDGEELKLNIMQESPFLGGSGGGGGGGGRPQVGGSPPSPPKNVRGGSSRGGKSGGELREKVKNMSPEEREKVIQKMKEDERSRGGEFREGGPERREIRR